MGNEIATRQRGEKVRVMQTLLTMITNNKDILRIQTVIKTKSLKTDFQPNFHIFI